MRLHGLPIIVEGEAIAMVTSYCRIFVHSMVPSPTTAVTTRSLHLPPLHGTPSQCVDECNTCSTEGGGTYMEECEYHQRVFWPSCIVDAVDE